MRKTIFISCGQYSDAEKQLGTRIAETVRTLTDLEPFFAEEVHSLDGLDANILGALHDCVAFITVLHPRGAIRRPDGSVLVRTSVWLEQEIAVATYIQRVERRSLPIIAFKHKSIGREGIRELLHLNPIEFEREDDVLAELPRHLESWKALKPSGIELQMKSDINRHQDGHAISMLQLILINETNDPIDKYDLEVRLPSSILKHWNANYFGEVRSNEPGIRCFRFDQSGFGSARPHDRISLSTHEYCTACAAAEHGGIAALVAEAKLGARVWINGGEYRVEKTIKQLAEER
jgi:hypothetical protein